MFGSKLILFYIKGEKKAWNKVCGSEGRDVPGITGCSAKGAEWLKENSTNSTFSHLASDLMWPVHDLGLFGYQYLSQMS